jgi:hypothetical protein
MPQLTLFFVLLLVSGPACFIHARRDGAESPAQKAKNNNVFNYLGGHVKRRKAPLLSDALSLPTASGRRIVTDGKKPAARPRLLLGESRLLSAPQNLTFTCWRSHVGLPAQESRNIELVVVRL